MSAFISDESGAVTVDWVVLTGAVAGLGLATMAVVSSGVESLSTETSDSLEGVSIMTRFASALSAVADFENGLGDWIGGAVSHSDAYGNVLRMGGTGGLQGTQATFDLDPNMGFAVATFDMHAIDSWDGESFLVFVNDEAVASASFQLATDGVTGQWVSSNPDVSFSVTPTSGRSDVGYSSEWMDQSYSMQVTVANAGPEMTLGFGSTLDQGVDDESWAVDNVTVISTDNP